MTFFFFTFFLVKLYKFLIYSTTALLHQIQEIPFQICTQKWDFINAFHSENYQVFNFCQLTAIYWHNQGSMDRYLSSPTVWFLDQVWTDWAIQKSGTDENYYIPLSSTRQISFVPESFSLALSGTLKGQKRVQRSLSKRLNMVFDIHSERILKGKTSLRNAGKAWFKCFHKPYYLTSKAVWSFEVGLSNGI